jgi:protein-S-isoprenylcysteine O-methyltransferase Ste14
VKKIIYPPFLTLFGLISQTFLDAYLPIVQAIVFPLWTGSVVVVLGLSIIVYTISLFKRQQTDVMPDGNPSILITHGIYKITRNPIYLGMTFILLGSAFLFGTLSTFFIPPLFMATVDLIWIRFEEKNLESIFGNRYTTYKESVRKWI